MVMNGRCESKSHESCVKLNSCSYMKHQTLEQSFSMVSAFQGIPMMRTSELAIIRFTTFKGGFIHNNFSLDNPIDIHRL